MFDYENLKKTDPEAYELLLQEFERQEDSLELIPSECIASNSVIEALGTPFTNKYSEGYPKKRYYGGNYIVDEIETLAIERAKEIFGVPHANVQPYSGSPANFAVYCALCNPGDSVSGLALSSGGHLTHGFSASMTGKFFDSHQYGILEDGSVNLVEFEEILKTYKPKLVWLGATASFKIIPFKEMSEIAEKYDCYIAADIAHISGLVIAGVHPSPVPYVHIVTTTTHKTLKGPRGGIIMVTEKGLQKDPDLAKKIDSAVFPGLQGGPHNHQTFAISVALGEAMKPEFKTLGENIIKNAKSLAKNLISNGINVVGNGTENHLLLVDCGFGRGIFLQEALDEAGITLNKNTIPGEKSSPFFPSGIRLGTPILTMRGMGESEMLEVAKLISEVFELVKDFNYSSDKEERKEILKSFYEFIESSEKLKNIKKRVKELTSKFPIYK